MSKYLIMLDEKRCISCKACEVHCKMKNNVPIGAKLGQLVHVGPVDHSGKPAILNMFMPCFHCNRPWCVEACPTNAMQVRPEDGLVFVDRDLCVGCKACIVSCPWMIPQWIDSDGTVMKCDLCMDRIDEGLDPACVTGCTAHALSLVDPNEASADTRKEFAKRQLLTNVDIRS